MDIKFLFFLIIRSQNRQNHSIISARQKPTNNLNYPLPIQPKKKTKKKRDPTTEHYCSRSVCSLVQQNYRRSLKNRRKDKNEGEKNRSEALEKDHRGSLTDAEVKARTAVAR